MSLMTPSLSLAMSYMARTLAISNFSSCDFFSSKAARFVD